VINTDEYTKLYEKYKAVYKEDEEKAKKLNPSFDMPIPKAWTAESVRLRAFLDRERKLYISTLGDFEFRLKKLYEPQEQTLYEELVSIYRDEYFRYQQREYKNLFFLGAKTPLEKTAKDFVLQDDSEIIIQFLYVWQEKIDRSKEKNIATDSVPVLRAKERELLQIFGHEISELVSLINKYSRELAKLLSEYMPKEVSSKEYKLQSYFQNSFDLTSEKEMREYLTLHTNHNIQNDIGQIRATIQNDIYENNKIAELELAKSSVHDKGDVLLKFAIFEQDIISKYRTLAHMYFSQIQKELDFMLVHKPFELYFDNYFADFELQLQYYKELYASKQQALVHTPYYMKMFNATQAKMSITNINITAKVERMKQDYISQRSYLTELKLIRREYEQEVVILLDEFFRYGEVYIKEIRQNSEDLKIHSKNIEDLRDRFDLRDEHGFF
jgi:hypothetical protein